MAPLLRFRYWLVRLKAWNRPWLWCLALALGLLGITLREYVQHPEWVGQFESGSESPSRLDGGGTQLTPDERGLLADVDNSAALLAEFGVEPFSLQAIPGQETAGADTLLSVLQELERPDSGLLLQPPETSDSPFADYLQQYRFAAAQPGGPSDLSVGVPSSSGLNAPPSSTGAAEATNPIRLSPLEQALQRQYGSYGSPLAQPIDGERARNGASLPGQPPLQQRTLPGSNLRFNLSAPQMSPPPGTTGYVPPITVPSPVFPSSNVAPLAPAAPPLAPNLSAPAPATTAPNLAAPGPRPGGTTYQAPTVETPQPVPFSAPRPPGSYTGGGYINTFSDPAGYVD